MERKFHVEKDKELIWWIVGLVAVGLWHFRDGWFPPASVLEKHPLGDPAHAYYYWYNKSVAVACALGALWCAYRQFLRK